MYFIMCYIVVKAVIQIQAQKLRKGTIIGTGHLWPIFYRAKPFTTSDIFILQVQVKRTFVFVS